MVGRHRIINAGGGPLLSGHVVNTGGVVVVVAVVDTGGGVVVVSTEVVRWLHCCRGCGCGSK